MFSFPQHQILENCAIEINWIYKFISNTQQHEIDGIWLGVGIRNYELLCTLSFANVYNDVLNGAINNFVYRIEIREKRS